LHAGESVEAWGQSGLLVWTRAARTAFPEGRV